MERNAYLDQFVPPSAHNDRVLRIRAEPHARHPLRMTLVGNGEFAVAQSVPELDGTIPRTGDDLAIVRGEGDGEDIIGMADEAAGGHTSSELPKAKCLVP